MNEALLELLGIDKNLSVDEIIAELEDKQVDFLTLQQTSSDEKRKAELADCIPQIEKEIDYFKQIKKERASGIILDVNGAPENSIKEEPPEKADNVSEKIEEMKREAAQKKAKATEKEGESSEKSDSDQTNTASAANSPAPSQPTAQNGGTQTGSNSVQLTGDSLKDALNMYKAKDFSGAFPGIKSASEAGTASAQFILAIMYFEGKGVTQDHNKGLFWLGKSADSGYSLAQVKFGEYIISASKGNSLDIVKGLGYLELAAAGGDENSKKAMADYVDTVIKQGVYVNSKTIAKAMEYCDALMKASNDSYETEMYRKAIVSLKQKKKQANYDANRKGPRGCLVRLIKIIVVLAIIVGVISIIYVVIKQPNLGLDKLGDDRANAALTADSETELGTVTVELHKLTPKQQACVTEKYDDNYSVDGTIWNGAFVYRAGNGQSTAYAIYEIKGLFETLTLEATPWLGEGVFFKDSSADIMIVNAESDEIICTQTIGFDSGIVNVKADISGVKLLGIYVEKTSSGLGDLAYTFIKNAYINPSKNDSESTTESKQLLYYVNGNIREGAGKEYPTILTSDGKKKFLATGKTKTLSDNSMWYEIYTDDTKTTTGWCYSSIITTAKK